jgi:hypothetical protein
VTPRLPSRPLLALVGLALLAPAAATAANPSPVAAPTSPAPVAATPPQTPVTPPPATTTRRTYTPAPTYTPPAKVTPTGPTPAQRAAARRAQQKLKAHTLALARQHRRQVQLLAAAQTHSEAVLRTELAAAKRANAVDLLAGSVAESIGAAPAGRLEGAAAAPAAAGSGGGSMPLPALMLAACAALLGAGAAFASRRGVGFATASLSLLVLLLAGI